MYFVGPDARKGRRYEKKCAIYRLQKIQLILKFSQPTIRKLFTVRFRLYCKRKKETRMVYNRYVCQKIGYLVRPFPPPALHTKSNHFDVQSRI